MFRKVLLAFSGLVGLFLLSSSIFADNYIYRFGTTKNWNNLFSDDPPAFNDEAPSTCSMRYDGAPPYPYVLTCSKPLTSNDQIEFNAYGPGPDIFVLTCFGIQPNKPVQLPTGCWCAAILPNTSCPNF